MIVIRQEGNFNKTENFLKKMSRTDFLTHLDKYGREGVRALSSATPMDTGLTANSWSYEIHSSGNTVTIYWTNSNVQSGVPIAVILQYGHGTRNGGYVQGRDYINPALRPVFDKIANDAWKEVTTG